MWHSTFKNGYFECCESFDCVNLLTNNVSFKANLALKYDLLLPNTLESDFVKAKNIHVTLCRPPSPHHLEQGFLNTRHAKSVYAALVSISSTLNAQIFRTKVLFWRQNVTREKRFRTKFWCQKRTFANNVNEIDTCAALKIKIYWKGGTSMLEMTKH